MRVSACRITRTLSPNKLPIFQPMATDKKRRGKFHFATLISFVSLATFSVELRSRESNLRRYEPRALAVKTTDVSGVCSFRNQTAPRNFAIKLKRGGVSVPDGVTPESLPIRYPPPPPVPHEWRNISRRHRRTYSRGPKSAQRLAAVIWRGR